jgi:RNA 3'-terminal phosphate cyclase (ATP)
VRGGAPLVEIDGSYGAGGGQILRTALALSVFTEKAARISRIRARRKTPGLAPQHLTGVLAAARISEAEVVGAEIGSTEVTFSPRKSVFDEDSLTIDVTQAARGGSAGSVTLILQNLLVPLALSGRRIDLVIKGGTHVAWSPPFDYFSDVFLPALSRMGLDAGCSLDEWGFYPVGEGRVAVRVAGIRSASGATSSHRWFQPVRLVERGDMIHVTGRAVVANLPKEIADRMARRAAEILSEKGFHSDLRSLRVGGKSTGAGIFLTAQYEKTRAGFSALGKRGLPAERVALDACRELFAFDKSGAAVDRHLADQLLLPMALASGRSEMAVESVTAHLLANAYVIQRFAPAAIEIVGDETGPGSVSVEGIDGRGATERS